MRTTFTEDAIAGLIGYDEIFDDPDGSLMGYLLYGEDIDLFDVEWFLATEHHEMRSARDHEGRPTAPQGGWEVTECWVRKVPGSDGYGGTWMTYHYQDQPGRGARKCVRVERHHSWGHWCHNHIYEPATTGFPVERVTQDPDLAQALIWPFIQTRIVAPTDRSRGRRDGEPAVYFCAECASIVNRDITGARLNTSPLAIPA